MIELGDLIRQFSVSRVDENQSKRILDDVATEEPLEMRISYWFKDVQMFETLAVTMRTPGHDRELAAGFLLSEAVIRSREDLSDLRSLGPAPSNELLAELSRNVDFDAWKLSRSSVVNSSCGICGKRTRDAIASQIPGPIKGQLRVPRSLISKLPELLRDRQKGFAKTGGLHAAALVNAAGEIEAVFEDIGRHNALDKLIGNCVLKNRLPLQNHLLFLSSRSSFELVQKAVMAGAPILATVGGPSSLAIETAREHSLTLIGFIRNAHFNIYSGDWRIDS
ncbi:MAG: formate dehydrogenase accessory sulfurtransferase FdhD [Bryobacteraceae bacterium]|jgi:FdhD protein